MTHTRLFYVLIFSLSLNVGVIGTLAFRHFREAGLSPRRQSGPPLTVKEICRSLPLQNEQCQQFQRIMPERQRQRRALRMELDKQRRELFQLLKKNHQAWPEIQGKLQELSALQGELEAAAVQTLLESMQTFTPQQRAAFLTMLEHRLFDSRDQGRGRGRGNRY
jgi:Spy/CpxP family protein refolding chaperone